MTRGAATAGLKVKWGFDFNAHAGETWQKNFPGATFHLLPVNEFAALPDPRKRLWIDILHLSPPCQVFSPIHTCPGRNDEMNYAALFGVMAAIEKARPRIVTLEQTFGILHQKHKDAFNGLISCFTNLSFDVSWKVVRFQGYGTPSRRTRLIILASWYVFLPSFVSYLFTILLSNLSTKSLNLTSLTVPENPSPTCPHPRTTTHSTSAPLKPPTSPPTKPSPPSPPPPPTTIPRTRDSIAQPAFPGTAARSAGQSSPAARASVSQTPVAA